MEFQNRLFEAWSMHFKCEDLRYEFYYLHKIPKKGFMKKNK